jgi:TonB family protein
MIQKRKKPNSSKVALVISVVFHALLFGSVLFFAAREGILGKKLKQLAVTMVKEKPPEPPKPKPEEPKPPVPKPVETAKQATPPPAAQVPTAKPEPSVAAPPAAAPAAVTLPSFAFNDGAKDVSTITDPNGVYKSLVEHAIKARWNRPEDMSDDNFAAEVEISINPKGDVLGTRWLSGSGNAQWDKTVQDAVSQVKAIGKEPPKAFPGTFVLRFDVETAPVDTIQVSVQ